MSIPGRAGDGDAAAHDASPPRELPPAHVLARLRAQLALEPAPRPAQSRALKWVALPLTALLLVGIDVALRHNSLLRADAERYLGLCLPSAAGAFVIAIAATLVATTRGGSGLGARVSLLRGSALFIGPLSALPMLWLIRASGEHGAFEQRLDPWGTPCLLISVSIAALSLLVLLRELRGTVPVAAGWRAAALGSAAGAWAGLALLLHCPSAQPQHLLIGHLSPIVLFPLAGRLVARRHLRV